MLDWLALIISLCAAALALWSLNIQRRDSLTEQKRFMRETITILHEHLQDSAFRSARQAHGKVFQKAYEDMDAEQKENARKILAQYGVLGRLIKHDAISRELFLNFWESTFRRDWSRLVAFVESERQSTGNTELFSAAEWIAKDIDRDDAR